jgi:hypothetical protein
MTGTEIVQLIVQLKKRGSDFNALSMGMVPRDGVLQLCAINDLREISSNNHPYICQWVAAGVSNFSDRPYPTIQPTGEIDERSNRRNKTAAANILGNPMDGKAT